MDLKPGEVICDKCNGEGDLGLKLSSVEVKIKEKLIKIPSRLKIEECPKCHGAGKLDWIEAVVGKKEDSYMWFTPTPGYRRGRINAIKPR